MNKGIPSVFTPENEPYLGRDSVHQFDLMIIWSLELNTDISRYTRDNSQSLTAVQKVACQVIPQGINLTLSIRELVRQGYLFAAAVLLRSLVERAAIISYVREKPESVMIWERGWKYRERPNFETMLKVMLGAVDEGESRIVCDTLNHLVHGDPMAAEYNLVDLGDEGLGFSVGKTLNDPELCDFVCYQTYCYLIVLTARAIDIFPKFNIREAPGSDAIH